jgi:hypothetical protein
LELTAYRSELSVGKARPFRRLFRRRRFALVGFDELKLYVEASGNLSETAIRGFILPFKADNRLSQFAARLNLRDPDVVFYPFGEFFFGELVRI